ncbi:hypothetical protein ACHAWF_001490 [Thalassiosira exigua]
MVSDRINRLLFSAVSVFGIVGTPVVAFSFRAAPSVEVHRHRATISAPHRHSSVAVATALRQSSTDEFPNNNSQEQEMMDQVLTEQQLFLQVQQGSEQMPSPDASQERLDPLIASLTRIDEPTPNNVPTVRAPLLGEIPADGNLALLVPAAAIGVLGFLFSIVVGFNSRDSIVQEMSKVELPKMEYTPTKVEEGKCRGLCSSQEEDIEGLRNFMEGLRKE